MTYSHKNEKILEIPNCQLYYCNFQWRYQKNTMVPDV